MATVNKRPSGKWLATVRKDGRSSPKTFTKRADATKWARNRDRSSMDQRSMGWSSAISIDVPRHGRWEGVVFDPSLIGLSGSATRLTVVRLSTWPTATTRHLFPMNDI